MDIVIDHRIRDWVFIPILYVMFMCGILKLFMSKGMQSQKKQTTTSRKTVDQGKDKLVMMHSQKLGACNGFLTEKGFYMRKHYFMRKDQGALWARENDAAADPMEAMSAGNPMMNPNNMTDMLKNNLFMTITTPLQFGFISYFFTGYLVGKVPFPLTQKFRDMLQKGVEIAAIDVKYVSALSLYFLTIFGFNSIYKMMFTNDGDENAAMDPMSDPSMNPMAMNPMMGGGGGSPFGGAPDSKAQMKAERDNLDIVCHKFKIEKAEKHLLNKWKKLKSQK